ncbi:MAG: type II toxin-antitoxin system antitoxin HigA [Gammaproteobacteria bacterium]|nr:MAG: type II toxin-antitoxin system antitoxin HigA [Gammaproteobacteria bacterium]
MTAVAFNDTCHRFAQAAAPYYHITDDEHYEEALELVENLLQEARDSMDDPLNAVIEMLNHAIETYESKDEELAAFEKRAMHQPADLAMLRLLMGQYGLGTADLPEIGSKSMVSRVLSGERSLSKKHIQALSKRFSINPGLFF